MTCDRYLPIFQIFPDGSLVNIEVGGMSAAEILSNGKFFQGGNWNHLHKLLELRSGQSLLYVGDHMYSDILRSKRTLGWRTLLVSANPFVPHLPYVLPARPVTYSAGPHTTQHTQGMNRSRACTALGHAAWRLQLRSFIFIHEVMNRRSLLDLVSRPQVEGAIPL